VCKTNSDDDALREALQHEKMQTKRLEQRLKECNTELYAQQNLVDDLNHQLQDAWREIEDLKAQLAKNTPSENARLHVQKQDENEQAQKLLLLEELRLMVQQDAAKNTSVTPSQESFGKPPRHSPRPPRLESESDLQPLLREQSLSDIVLAGPPWAPPAVQGPFQEREEKAALEFKRVLEGSYVQPLLGMQLTEVGEEIYEPGDIGTVTGYWHGEAEDSHINVKWGRTGRSSSVPQSSWIWFRFIRTPEPQVNDFLQPLPGGGIDEMGTEVCRVEDVGQVMSASASCVKAFQIRWPRTGKSADIMPTSWNWFRYFRAPCDDVEGMNASSSRSFGDDLMNVSSSSSTGDTKDNTFAVLWIRPGEVVSQPSVGDTIQVLPGTRFVDEHTKCCYSEGDVATVIRFASDETSGAVSAVVIWMQGGQISSIARQLWTSFSFFHKPEPRIGDMVTASLRNSISNGDIGIGDCGSVLSVRPSTAHGEGGIRILWRTGEVSDCPMSSWQTRFNLIPLQSVRPTYVVWPLGSTE
jgi:uncharacterized coiled-coil protein SlyX